MQRDVLRHIRLILAGSVVLLGAGVCGLEAAERPNILVLTSEDNSHHWLGCYGDEDAETPNLDQLAADGVRYTSAYANAPVCAVARFTMITGRYACSMGTQNMRSRYPIPPRFRTYVSWLREAGYYCTNSSKTDYNFATKDESHWDESSKEAHWKNRPEGAPFFAVFNTTISHESSLFARKKASAPEPRRDPGSVTLPPFLPDTPELRQDWVTYMDVVTRMDKAIGDRLRELAEAGLAEDTIVIYFSDHGGVLPRSKRYVYDTGTRVPMIVHVPAKWREWAPGEAGTTCERRVSFIDVPPTFLSLAGIPVPSYMQGRAFLGEGVREPESHVFLFGQRFDARMLRFVRAVTDGRFRYIRNFYPHRSRGIFTGYPYGQAGWNSFLALQQAGKTSPAQSSFWDVPQPVEELYDTEADPWEVTNLAGDPNYEGKLKRMRASLLQKMREIRDTGLVPEAMYNELSDNGTVYAYVNNPGFPYDRVLELALSASEGRAEIERLQAAMADAHPVIRVWGALGSTLLGAGAAEVSSDLNRLLEDPVPAVQLAALEALVVAGERPPALRALNRILTETRDDVVVMEALNLAHVYDLVKDVPRETYVRACGVGTYAPRLMDDYPDP